jgi:hypothetical protein
LDRETAHAKELIGPRYAELVYFGQWHSPLRRALDAFVNETQKVVTGEVKLKLYKGNIVVQGRTSPHSLYWQKLASFEAEDIYNQKDAEGFINLFGLPIKVAALLRKGRGKQKAEFFMKNKTVTPAEFVASIDFDGRLAPYDLTGVHGPCGDVGAAKNSVAGGRG